MVESNREGSHFRYDVTVAQGVKIPARDGVELATDLYFPAVGEQRLSAKVPAILERTPYLKRHTRYFRKASWYARLGYAYAVQDVRGRGDSGGEWYPFAEEAPDGYDTVEWLAEQPWSNGKVGTIGTSYAGSDQSALATLDPPHLAAQFISMGASNYHDCSMRHNGCLEQRFIVYAFWMAVTSPEAESDPIVKSVLAEARDQIDVWLRRLPIRKGQTPLELVPKIEQWVLDIQNRGNYDDYWKQRGLSIEHYWDEQADVPTLFFGGWYDSYARATPTNFVELNRRKTSPIYLVMGPWTHGDSTCEVSTSGDVDFGPEAAQDVYHRLPLRFFDTHLKGMQTGFAEEARVRFFVMGGGCGQLTEEGHLFHGGRWERAETWPLPTAKPTPFYLHSDGQLTAAPPAVSASSQKASTTFVFDPSNPVPTIGGCISAANIVMEPGAFDQRGKPSGTEKRYAFLRKQDFFGTTDTLPLASRQDVLVFQTTPLETPIEVVGPIVARLWISSSTFDTDFTAKLIDVYPASTDYPEGYAMRLTDTIQRCRYRDRRESPELMTPGDIYALEFSFYPTANRFAEGHRVRVDVSSSNWPRFDVNPNTGEELGQHRTLTTATNTVHHNDQYPSHIELYVSS